MKFFTAVATCALVALTASSASAQSKIKIVAAENFYGDVAQQIAGPEAQVTSILNNPDQDPHLFETTPGLMRDVSAAQIVIYNGADYDAWMPKLLKVSSVSGQTIIVAADLTHKKTGENPHLWYDPKTMPIVAKTLAEALAKIDPAHANDYYARAASFLDSLIAIDAKVTALRSRFSGKVVTATEPVFGYMASALGLKMRNERLQLAIMNDTEPSARDIAAFENDLKSHSVKVMFYNKQASSKVVQHLVDLAHGSNVPVVGVTETVPPGLSYQQWLTAELDETEKALGSNP
jgi:zinc/manganese transport system substrate-binding protein